MNLKLIKSKKIPSVVFLKTYEYRDFLININIDDSGFVEIEASDQFKEILVKAINDEPAILCVENICLSSRESILKLIERLETAEQLLEMLNENREFLIKEDSI